MLYNLNQRSDDEFVCSVDSSNSTLVVLGYCPNQINVLLKKSPNRSKPTRGVSYQGASTS
jgi:hypothetical protein